MADGTLTVWDLNSWNAALGSPVNVTLRATNNLILNASLSDGFSNNGKPQLSNWAFGESATDVDSATYRLTAGADFSSADPLAVRAQPVASSSTAGTPNTGNVILTPGNLVRTGDGSIDIAAGGDVLIGYTESYDANNNLQVAESDPLSSVIYTAGIKSAASTSSPFTLPNSGGSGVNAYSPSYPTAGGDISISAASDIRSAPSEQLVTDWLWRRGTLSSDGVTFTNLSQTTSWWIVFNAFQQGIGALGGGNITLNAGANIVDVSAVIPTTGQLRVATGTQATDTNLSVLGGGTLSVRAGGNVESGVFEDDWGNAAINAGGALSSGTTVGAEIPVPLTGIDTTMPIYPVILLGGGTFDINAVAGVQLNLVGNSTLLPESTANANSNIGHGIAYFSTYSAATALNVTSAGANVILDEDANNLPIGILVSNGSGGPIRYGNDVGTCNSTPCWTFVYPPTLTATALSGDIDILTTLNLFPSSTGNLSLLAQGSIGGSAADGLTSSFAVTVGETDPASWPNPVLPKTLPAFAPIEPSVPLHQSDTQPIYVVADTGNIVNATLTFPKAADIVAGGDIDSLNYTGKNLNPSDVTLIEAGGNVEYSTLTAPPNNDLVFNNIGIDVGGPGYVEVLAGRTIDLGDSNGIQSTANLADSRLAATGASLVVGAGFGTDANGEMRQPAYQSFINTYLAPGANGSPSTYAGALISYMAQLYPATDYNLSYSNALTAFQALTPQQGLPLLAQVLSAELSATGLAHNNQGLGYDRGYNAINTLFPTKDAQGNPLTYQGDINMFFSPAEDRGGWRHRSAGARRLGDRGRAESPGISRCGEDLEN